MTNKSEDVYHLENTTSKLNASLNISLTSSLTPVTLTYNVGASQQQQQSLTNFSLTNMGPPPASPATTNVMPVFSKPLKASKMLTDMEYNSKKAEPVSRIKGTLL